MNFSLRDVCEADTPFLFEIYCSTREFELSQVPWTPEQKHAFLEMQFAAQVRGYAANHPNASHQIISVNGEPVGRLYLDREENQFHILDITIAPAARNRGTGTAVLGEILAEAGQAGKAVTIYTESFNPSTRLFQRLGFHVSSQDGFLLLLERPSGAAAESHG